MSFLDSDSEDIYGEENKSGSDYTGSIELSDCDDQVPRIKRSKSKEALGLKR